MRKHPGLSHEQAKRFYDRLGSRQDWQGFYENVAIEVLVRNAAFGAAGSVLEFGCGTGRFAESLMEKHLPAHARYVGVDLSDTMVGLTQKRLSRFGGRAEVRRSEGAPRLDFGEGTFDRFVSNYVLDLLSWEDIQVILQEAWRVLSPGGLLGLTSLTPGFTALSRAVTAVWRAIYSMRPMLVGGCRPIHLIELVDEEKWHIRFHDRFCRYGMPSEVLVAEKVVTM